MSHHHGHHHGHHAQNNFLPSNNGFGGVPNSFEQGFVIQILFEINITRIVYKYVYS